MQKPTRPSRASPAPRGGAVRARRKLTRAVLRGVWVAPADVYRKALQAALRRALAVLRALLRADVARRRDAVPDVALDGTRAAFAAYVAGRLRAEVSRIGKAIFGASKAAWESAKRITKIKAASIAPGGQKQIDRFVRRNVDLISTVGEREIRKVENLVNGPGAGLHTKALQARIQEETGADDARAELWARDQTLKLHAEIKETQARSAGMQRYRWNGATDAREREDHLLLEGRIFLFAQPPVTNASEVLKGKPARRENPGGDYQCRCAAEPIPDDETGADLLPVTFDGHGFRRAQWSPGTPEETTGEE